MNNLEHGLEVSEAQEELVRLNLKIKSLTGSFDDCNDYLGMVNLNTDIRSDIDKMRRTLDVLRTLANRQTDKDSLKMLMKDVDSHSDQLASCQSGFRIANVKCIARLEAAGRQDLFQISQDVGLRNRGGGVNQEEAVRESSRATDRMAAISRQLAETVERSSDTVAALAESSQTVAETRDEYGNMGGIIAQSGRLITKFARRETTDKVLILFAVAFYFAVVFYILRKRVLGPLDPLVLIWSTMKTFVIALVQLIRTMQAFVVDAFV